jgi:alpha-beta hydrolase superfamily lysophospholipase
MESFDMSAVEQRAAAWVDAFLAGDFETLRKAGDPAFAAAILPEALARVREQLGPARAHGTRRAALQEGVARVEARIEFEGGEAVFRISLRDGALVGFFVAPPVPAWRAPPYVDAARFVEEPAFVGDLPSVLTRPNGVRRPPVCLFVHGSGPCDRDETIGPNKPFRDLAQGLATRGVASLRYDKRSFAFPAEWSAVAAPTVKDEALDDVAAALELLAGRDDFGPILVVGHSLGAVLAPRILAQSSRAAAAVMIAAPARPLVEVALSQIEYLDRLQPSGRLDAMRAAAARARAARPGEEGEPFLGAPLSYWADLNLYDPVATAQRIEAPLLILHGGRDYQVIDADFEIWQARLGGRPSVGLRRFADLNHLMMTGRGPSQPAEYREAGHVDADVVAAIAEFALSL